MSAGATDVVEIWVVVTVAGRPVAGGGVVVTVTVATAGARAEDPCDDRAADDGAAVDVGPARPELRCRVVAVDVAAVDGAAGIGEPELAISGVADIGDDER